MNEDDTSKIPFVQELSDEYFMRKALGEAMLAYDEDEVPGPDRVRRASWNGRLSRRGTAWRVSPQDSCNSSRSADA